MADVITKTRTNYFSTTDPEKLKALLSGVKTDGRPVTLCSLDGKLGHPHGRLKNKERRHIR